MSHKIFMGLRVERMEFRGRRRIRHCRTLTTQGILVLLLYCNAPAQTYNSAVVSGYAFEGIYSKSNSNFAKSSTTGDSSTGYGIWDSSAQSVSEFRSNSAFAEVSYSYAVGYGDPSYAENPSASASFDFNWSVAGTSQAGSIVSVAAGLGDSLNGKYSGVLSFVYGTPYTIQSLLAVNSAIPYASAETRSAWADTITFLGQPDGTPGSATFTISLDCSISKQESQIQSGSLLFDKTTIVGDWNGGAVLSGVQLPVGTSIQAVSGFSYPVPEPGAALLLGLGLGGMWYCRSKRKSHPRFHD